eukprot:c25088_g3_i2 orf=208-1653(-)
MASDSPSLSRVLGSSENNWFKSTAGGTGIVPVGIALKRSVEIQLISDAAQEVLAHHALLRACVTEDAKGKLCFLVDGTSASPVVEERTWPTLSECSNLSGVILYPLDYEDKSLSMALSKIVREEINIPFLNVEEKSSSVNLFEIHVYANSSRPGTVIVLRIHSAAFDRQSSCVVVQDFLAALNALVEGGGPKLLTNPGKDSLLPCMEDLIPKTKSSKGFLQKGMDAVGYAWNSKNYSLLPFNPDVSAVRSKHRESDILSYSLGTHGTASLFTACKQEGVSYAEALAAAILQTAANVKELKEKKQDEFFYTSVLNCRRFFDPPLSESILGNYSSGVPHGVKVKDGVSFWDFARQISASNEKDLAKSKYFSELPVLGMLFSQVLKHPNLTPSSSLRSALFTMFMDGPMNAQWKNVEALQLVGTLGPLLSVHFVGPCFGVVESLHQGPELHLSFVYAIPVHTKEQVESFVGSTLELLSSATKGY